MGDLRSVCTHPAQARELMDRLEAKVAAQSTLRDAALAREEKQSFLGGRGWDEPPD